MSDYAGIHGGDKIYCGVAIQPYLTADGALTGTSCHSILATGAVGSLVINNATIALIDGGTLDVGINTISGTLTNACFICTCHDCSDPLGAFAYPSQSIAYNYSGGTFIGGDGGSGLGGNSGGERPVNSYSDPTTTYYRLGIQGLRN